MPEEHLQQRQLPHGQDQLGAGPVRAAGADIHPEVAVAQGRGVRWVAAGADRAQAGGQLGEAERLGQVVVGARVEAVHPVRDVMARGEHDDRQRQAGCP